MLNHYCLHHITHLLLAHWCMMCTLLEYKSLSLGRHLIYQNISVNNDKNCICPFFSKCTVTTFTVGLRRVQTAISIRGSTCLSTSSPAQQWTQLCASSNAPAAITPVTNFTFKQRTPERCTEVHSMFLGYTSGYKPELPLLIIEAGPMCWWMSAFSNVPPKSLH